MKNVIIVDKINHIIIESREEEVSDVGGKWDTFLEVDAFCVITIPFSVLFLFFLNGGITPVLHQPSVMSLIDCLEENSRFQGQSCFLAVAIKLPGVR